MSARKVRSTTYARVGVVHLGEESPWGVRRGWRGEDEAWWTILVKERKRRGRK